MERFYTFFGSSLKKDLDLLRFLYLQKRFVPIEEISATLALDRRSIQKSFIALTKQLEQNAEEKHPILLAKHGAGYKFNGNKTDYKHLLRQLLAKNPFFQLLETLLLHNEINVVQFANDYFFSESTVRKRVYELENLLAPLGFTLKNPKEMYS
nr:helix-turn-helix domain-containing protein [Enterococcus innesii]